jgi:hypothetical protein
MPRKLHHELSDDKIKTAVTDRAKERARVRRLLAAGKTHDDEGHDLKHQLKMLRDLGPEDADDHYSLTDGDGLFLDVDTRKTKGNQRIWRVVGYVNGSRTKWSYDDYPRVSIDAARGMLKEDLDYLANTPIGQQVNPTERRRAIAEGLAKQRALQAQNALLIADGDAPVGTFQWKALEWHKANKGSWKTEYAANVKRMLEKDAFPVIGSKLLTEVTAADIFKIRTNITTRKHKTKSTRGNKPTADLVIGYLKAIFDLAAYDGDITATPVIAMPASVAKLHKARASAPRPGVTTLPMLHKLVHDVMGVTSPRREGARDAFFFGLCVGQRLDTVNNAQWAHVKLDYPAKGIGEWHIPRWTLDTHDEEVTVKGAMKGKKTSIIKGNFVVPLSTDLVIMLKARKAEIIARRGVAGTFVFPNRNLKNADASGQAHSLIPRMLNDLGYKGIHCNHGSRATMRTLLPSTASYMGLQCMGATGKVNGLDFNVALACEKQIDHKHGEETKEETTSMTGVYERNDMLNERRVLVEHWTRLIKKLSELELPQAANDLEIEHESAAPALMFTRPQLAA